MFYNHLYMFFLLLSISFFFLFLLVFSIILNQSFYFSCDIFSMSFLTLDFTLYLDWMSLLFLFLVSMISSVIMVYSFFYIMPYNHSVYFLWFTFLFVVSILFVVSMSNFFYIILGWDGLGVVSFFLIVYYQNSSSITSGVFTFLINRLGDGFFLLGISVYILYLPSNFVFFSDLPSFILVCFILLAFITNSALYPFSSWLPLAIAAPTPISALVHSSTLVTAGLFLMMRYSYVLYSFPLLIQILTVVGLFTSFYAGLNSIFETDLNNVIALSTLSHLGFICFSFSSGLLILSYFHLLVHALFNSLLFMAMGDVISNLSHSQDSRFLSGGLSYTPISSFTMLVSVLNLLGMPFVSGFFSNDLILELFLFSNSSYVLVSMMYLNIFFTYFYTYFIFYFSYSSLKVSSIQFVKVPVVLHVCLLFWSSILALLFFFLFMNFVYVWVLFVSVPEGVNLFPLFLNIVIFSFLSFFVFFPSSNSSTFWYMFSNILFLSQVLLPVSTYFFYRVSFFLVNDFELGLVNSVFHISTANLSSNVFFSVLGFMGFQFLLVLGFILFLTFFLFF